MERLQARDPVQLAVQALKLAEEEGCSVLIYDSVGVGSGVRGELNKHEDSNIEFRKFVAQGEVLRKNPGIAAVVRTKKNSITCVRKHGGLTATRLMIRFAGWKQVWCHQTDYLLFQTKYHADILTAFCLIRLALCGKPRQTTKFLSKRRRKLKNGLACQLTTLTPYSPIWYA